MREKIETLIGAIVELPPPFFYGIWIFGFLAVVAFLLMRDDQAPVIELGPTNDVLRHESSPDQIGSPFLTLDQLVSQAPQSVIDSQELESKLHELEDFISAQIVGNYESTPQWISENLVASGVDRASFADRFQSNAIQVRRWRKSDAAPLFESSDALGLLIESCLGPWRTCDDFRIEIRPYRSQVESGKTSVSLIVECFGIFDKTSSQQGTAIWLSEWSPEFGQRKLQTVSVLAQEEIKTAVYDGKMFRDCTASILKRCESLERQLVFGLDQWAQRIPHLDVTGKQGLCVGDINRDGLDDIYVCQPHGLPNLLFTQNADGTVDDASHAAKVDLLDATFAAVMVDLDNDRDQDLALTTDESLVLLSNNGSNVFQVEHRLPLGRQAASISAADYDQDGDLDLFLCKTNPIVQQNDLLQILPAFDPNARGGRNILLQNNEGWEFKDVTESVGFTSDNDEFTRCAVWLDFDFDGDQDLYVSNDFASDRIFRNDDGWFSDVTNAQNMHQVARHRTASVGDFNQDGRFDVFAGTLASSAAIEAANSWTKPATENREPAGSMDAMLTAEDHVWYSAAPEGFTPFFLRAPLFATQSASGSVAADLNNDGLDDIVVSNGGLSRSLADDLAALLFAARFIDQDADTRTPSGGWNQLLNNISDLCRAGYSFASKERNKCFLSIGRLGFANLSSSSGLDLPDDARAVASTDWDNDGDTDIIMTCRTGPQLRIFCNQLITENGYVAFHLRGTESNADAIGARVELYLAGAEFPLVKTLQAGSGFLSQSSKQLVFGIGKEKTVERAVITWPNGKQQTFSDLVVNTRYRAVEGLGELTEKRSGRFRFSIESKQLAGVNSAPESGRTVFYPPSALPQMMFEGAEETYYPIETIGGNPLLIVFFSRDSKSDAVLGELTRSSPQIAGEDLDCLALFCDPISAEAEQDWQTAKLAIANSRFPFRWGRLTDASRDKLQYMVGEWFTRQQLPRFPFALLMSGDNDVVAFYPSNSIAIGTIIADNKSISRNDRNIAESSSPLAGRWVARYRHSNYSGLIQRLNANGYGDATQNLAERSQPFAALQLCHQAIELQARGETNEAKLLLEEAIELDARCVLAHVELGEAYRRFALSDPGLTDEDKSILQQMASDQFKLANQLDPLNIEAMIGQANVAVDQGRIDEAVARLTEDVMIVPEHYEIHALLGRLKFYQQEYREAEEYLVKAFENRPSIPYVSGDLGFLYLQRGQFKDARRFLALALRLTPSDANTLRLLAEAEFGNNNFEVATDLFEKVVEVAPNRRRPKLMLAWLLATCPFKDQRNGQRALEIISPLVETGGQKSPVLLEIQAAAFAEAGKFDSASKLQEKAVELAESSNSSEIYTADQKTGMLKRNELYRRGRPFRTTEISQTPVAPPTPADD